MLFFFKLTFFLFWWFIGHSTKYIENKNEVEILDEMLTCIPISWDLVYSSFYTVWLTTNGLADDKKLQKDEGKLIKIFEMVILHLKNTFKINKTPEKLAL